MKAYAPCIENSELNRKYGSCLQDQDRPDLKANHNEYGKSFIWRKQKYTDQAGLRNE